MTHRCRGTLNISDSSIWGLFEQSTCSAGQAASSFLLLFVRLLLASLSGKKQSLEATQMWAYLLTAHELLRQTKPFSHLHFSCSSDPGNLLSLTELVHPEFSTLSALKRERTRSLPLANGPRKLCTVFETCFQFWFPTGILLPRKIWLYVKA